MGASVPSASRSLSSAPLVREAVSLRHDSYGQVDIFQMAGATSRKAAPKSGHRLGKKKQTSHWICYRGNMYGIEHLAGVLGGKVRVAQSTRVARFFSSYASNAVPDSLHAAANILAIDATIIRPGDIIIVFIEGKEIKKGKIDRQKEPGEVRVVYVIQVYQRSPKKQSGGFLRQSITVGVERHTDKEVGLTHCFSAVETLLLPNGLYSFSTESWDAASNKFVGGPRHSIHATDSFVAHTSSRVNASVSPMEVIIAADCVETAQAQIESYRAEEQKRHDIKEIERKAKNAAAKTKRAVKQETMTGGRS